MSLPVDVTFAKEIDNLPDSYMLTAPQMAAIVGVSPGSLLRLRQRGEGPPYKKLGASVRYPLGEYRKWVAVNDAPPPLPPEVKPRPVAYMRSPARSQKPQNFVFKVHA